MTIFGVGLHVLVALFFAIHAIRSGQQMYWLMILFLFPGLGSIVYFFAIYLPGSKLQHGTRKAVTVAARSLDPNRELREARAAFDYTPTAQNQMRLAAAQLDAGDAAASAATYEACLQGVFASDLEIRYGAARANVACGRYAAAVAHLEWIRARDANFRAELIALLLAQALAGAGRQAEARWNLKRRWRASAASRRAPNSRSGRPAAAISRWPANCIPSCIRPCRTGVARRATSTCR